LLRDTALEDARITSFRLKWYTDLSEELRKYGIPVHDISKLVKFVNNIGEYDYDVEKVINEFSNLERPPSCFVTDMEFSTDMKYANSQRLWIIGGLVQRSLYG
jgi:hypothetical protein